MLRIRAWAPMVTAALASLVPLAAGAQQVELPPITIPEARTAPPVSVGRDPLPGPGQSGSARKRMPSDVRKMASQYTRAAKACQVAVASGPGPSPVCTRRDNLSAMIQSRGWSLPDAMAQLTDECTAKGQAAQVIGGIRGAGQSPQTAFDQVTRMRALVDVPHDYVKTLVNYAYFGDGRSFGPYDLQTIVSNACYFGPNDDPAWQPLR